MGNRAEQRDRQQGVNDKQHHNHAFLDFRSLYTRNRRWMSSPAFAVRNLPQSFETNPFSAYLRLQKPPHNVSRNANKARLSARSQFASRSLRQAKLSHF